jgi:transcriptional regulator with XRE-family HTH domain
MQVENMQQPGQHIAHHTTMAVLRRSIGLTQGEMASVLGCSLPTVRAVEQRKLNLSKRLAQKAAYRTGADTAWLLKGDPVEPAVGPGGEVINGENFLKRQATLAIPGKKLPREEVTGRILSRNCRHFMAVLLAAERQGKGEFLNYQLHGFLKEMEKQLGIDQELAPKPLSHGGRLLLVGWKKDFANAIQEFSAALRLLYSMKSGGKSAEQSPRHSKN